MVYSIGAIKLNTKVALIEALIYSDDFTMHEENNRMVTIHYLITPTDL